MHSLVFHKFHLGSTFSPLLFVRYVAVVTLHIVIVSGSYNCDSGEGNIGISLGQRHWLRENHPLINSVKIFLEGDSKVII